MSGDLVPVADAGLEAIASAARYALNEKAAGTRRAYASAWRGFETWCASVEAKPLPAAAAIVAAYLAHLADSGLKLATIEVRAAAIAYVHELHGFEYPRAAVKTILSGIRRTIGAPKVAKSPATAKLMAAMVRRIPNDLAGKRDKALLLIGFAAALRRSELVALQVAAIERAAGGIFLTIGRSKTDQEGRGAVVPVPEGSKLKPVAALDAWLAASAINEGPVFRQISRTGRIGEALTPQSVALIIKRRAEAAKLDPKLFAGHSLRAGFVTSALEGGGDLLKIMHVTRHREVKTLEIYDRRANAFRDHAGKKFL
jgi:site-specific recombinase XerD